MYTKVEEVLVEEEGAPLFIVHHQASVKDVLAHDHNFICNEFVFFIEKLIPCVCVCVQNGREAVRFLNGMARKAREPCMNGIASLLGKGDKGILGGKQPCSHVVVAVLIGE